MRTAKSSPRFLGLYMQGEQLAGANGDQQANGRAAGSHRHFCVRDAWVFDGLV